MKTIKITIILIIASLGYAKAQSDGCATPNLDSAFAVSLPYFDNTELLTSTLLQQGYYNLQQTSFPPPPPPPPSKKLNSAKAITHTFLETKYLIPLEIFIYRENNDANTAISEIQAQDYVCGMNDLYREADTGIQFYINTITIDGNSNYNNQLSSNFDAYLMFANKRLSQPDNGINVHFVRNTIGGLSGTTGLSSIPRFNIPLEEYSLFVRTHENSNPILTRNRDNIISTFAHELGHNIGLLHTHHPGRLPSLIFNEENATIANGCYQEAVWRGRKNKFFAGCFATGGKLKARINGDFLEDTEADPNVSSLIDGNCLFVPPPSGDFRTDNWNTVWTPNTNNVMSYTTATCRTFFTEQQIGVIWNEIPKLKSYINYQEPKINLSANAICSGGSLTASVVNIPTLNTTITWQVSPSNLVTSSTGSGSTAILQAASTSASGSVTITFTVVGNNNCFLYTIDKTIWVGRPPASIGGTLTGPSSTYAGQLVTYTHSGGTSEGTYDWTLPYNERFCTSCWSVFTGGDGSNQVRAIAGSSSGYVQVRKGNACGYGGAKLLYVTVSGGGGGGPIELRISPNPTPKTDLNVSFYSRETGLPLDPKDFNNDIGYIIRNMNGEIKHNSKSRKKSKKINIRHLKSNKQYILSVDFGDGNFEQANFRVE